MGWVHSVSGEVPTRSLRSENIGTAPSSRSPPPSVHAKADEGLSTTQKEEPMMQDQRIGRFSDGQETIVATPQRTRLGRFSDGQASDYDGPEQVAVGRFSTGRELLAETSAHIRIGSFGDHERGRSSIVLQRQAESPYEVAVEAEEAS